MLCKVAMPGEMVLIDLFRVIIIFTLLGKTGRFVADLSELGMAGGLHHR